MSEYYISITAALSFHNSYRSMIYDGHFRNDIFVVLSVPAKIITKAFFDFPHVAVVYFGCAISTINLCDSNFQAGKTSTQFDGQLCKYIFALSRFGRNTPFFHEMVILLSWLERIFECQILEILKYDILDYTRMNFSWIILSRICMFISSLLLL